MTKQLLATPFIILIAAGLSACDSDNTTTPDSGTTDGRSPDRGLGSPDGEASACRGANYAEDVTACDPQATDYQPRQGTPGANGWPQCISDDNVWHLIGTGLPAAVSRSIAFESMGTKLWSQAGSPSKDDFLAARDEYSVAEGLASRVGRRQDIHYPEVPGNDKFACQNEGIPKQYPDRCAGPAKLKPIIDDAFQQGLAQIKPLVQAARIEAALLWFFYLSMTSEVWTCSFDDIGDCDSAAGYYTQVSARSQPVGLARYVSTQGPETHHRIYDALLAARCWRDIDKQMPAQAESMTFYDLAQAQLNKAALRGEALILRERIGRIPRCTSEEAREAQVEFVKTLGGLIDHAARLIDATNATQLKNYTSNPTADTEAVAAAQSAIDAIFQCP